MNQWPKCSHVFTIQTLSIRTFQAHHQDNKYQNDSKEKNSNINSDYKFKSFLALLGIVTGSGIVFSLKRKENLHAKSAASVGVQKPQLYSKDEVARHYNEEKRVLTPLLFLLMYCIIYNHPEVIHV